MTKRFKIAIEATVLVDTSAEAVQIAQRALGVVSGSHPLPARDDLCSGPRAADHAPARLSTVIQLPRRRHNIVAQQA